VGKAAKADPAATFLSKLQLGRIAKGWKTDSNLVPKLGKLEDVIKSGNRLLVQRDKEAKAVMEDGKLKLQGLEKGQQLLAKKDLTGVASVLGRLTAVEMNTISTANKTRLDVRESRATMEALDVTETEPVLRDSQRKQLEKQAREAEQRRSLSASTRFFQGAGEKRIAAEALLSDAENRSAGVAGVDAGVLEAARKPKPTKRRGKSLQQNPKAQ
jgi:hypothetical protein